MGPVQGSNEAVRSEFVSAILKGGQNCCVVKTKQDLPGIGIAQNIMQCQSACDDDSGQRPKIDKVVSELRETYEKKLEQFKVFYSTFCPPSKVIDSALYANDLEEKLKKLLYSQFNFLPSQYLEHYEDVIIKVTELYEFANLKTLINIYETHLSQITDEVNINYVINALVPAVRDEHIKTFKNYKEKKWIQIKNSEAFPLWKGVTDIKAELELINKVVKSDISDINDLENSLEHLTVMPKWEERDDMLILGKVVEFVKYVNDNNPIDNENYWSLINELASASDLLEFLQITAEDVIKNLINDVDDFSDKRLILEDTVSSLIHVKQFRNISNREEVTKEKIQKAVSRGTYTFDKVDKSDIFNVTLVYQAKGADKIKYNISDLLCLREGALLITEPANMYADLTEEEKSRKIMNEFVLQVNTAQEILIVGSKLIQMWHFDYRRKKAVGEAQEQHYYLTFFPARHILAFYDYFTSDVQDDENTEICRTLIKLVNNKAELPSRKDRSGISRKNTDYFRTLKEIGERNAADVVDRGKICVASCDDKLHIPNIIMSFNITCVSSDLSGQGKTEWIKQASLKEKKNLHSFLIDDGANYESLVCQLKDFKIYPTESLHINIMSVDHPDEINMFLFELSTLGCVSSNVNVISFSRIPIFIELASTIQQKLLNSLPMTNYLIKEHLSWNIRNLNVSSELYNAFEKHELDERDIIIDGLNCIKKPLSDERCQDLIEKYIFKGFIDGINSFRFVEIFTNVLADQLVRLSPSAYLTVENLKLLINENTLLRTTLAKVAQLNSTFNDYDSKFEIVQWDAYNYLLIIFMSQNPDSIYKWKLEDYNRMAPKSLLEILEYLARRTTHKIDLPLYALSTDNLVKMALILLRARSNVPVVIMGEAGCWKVEVNYEPFNLHAGIKEQDILDFMEKVQKKAENSELWLFLDEINTRNHIGLLANIIAQRTLNGKLLHHNIRTFSACNPYRKRIKAQSQDGLKTKVKRYEELSSLVYQVKPLPDQILDYVWNYGFLIPNDEKKYIQVMVQTRFGEGHDLFTELLFSSQQFIRSIEEKYSVSLRDVKRAIKLVDFFNESLCSRHSRNRPHLPNPDNLGRINFTIRCYILALSLCYQSRIYDQESRNNDFIKVIRDEQEDWIKRMQLPPNTAMNEALLENVLAMFVCILAKIPVFIIGAPGSSKSLAIKLVGQNLRGSDSNDRYFRKLPQACLISYQGSSSSTSDGIIKAFEKANKYQEIRSKEFPVIGVVVFDGIGLAETNPDNPLK
ncbi:36932_t:CDS:10, partial [Gigaspora margarita]